MKANTITKLEIRALVAAATLVAKVAVHFQGFSQITEPFRGNPVINKLAWVVTEHLIESVFGSMPF